MLERTTRTYLDDILSKDFSSLQDNNLIALEQKRSLRIRVKNSESSVQEHGLCKDADTDDNIMTRKTRTRRPRITVIQSGYCAVCNLPYNNVEDHIQSKKHQKLIGEDANYIALNGSLNGFLQTNNIPFLNLNGIDAIGVHDNSLDDFSTKYRRRAMPKTRAASVVCERIKPSPLSPTGSDTIGHHHLRSRRNVNYMTPPLDDDSLQESIDISLPSEEPVHPVFKEYRELRSSTRALAKLTERVTEPHEDVWSSGRPKRSCIRTKRLSLDDNTTTCKTYYKVEVMTGKTKSEQEKNKRPISQSPKREDGRKDTGLIVKFKKLRNSELIQLNNEATNFLFPKKDDSDKEDEVAVDDNVSIKSIVAHEKTNNKIIASDPEDCGKKSNKIKMEDDTSADSTSSHKVKKKRRTHAEAFILDNQKYYKFETPGSRLRYQGSYLPPLVKSLKHNGQLSPKKEDIKSEDVTEEESEQSQNGLQVNNFQYCFEKVPSNSAWYKTFQRVDRAEQRYQFFSDSFWDPFILPFQMPRITPVDSKVCMAEYLQVLKTLKESISTENSLCSSPEPCTSVSTLAYEQEIPDIDEDSKMSAITSSSVDSNEETTDKKDICKSNILQTISCGKNPRKSPRQHASTLAILSSLLNQRKRRAKPRLPVEPIPNLPTIPEEIKRPDTPIFEEKQDQVETAKDKQALAEPLEEKLDSVELPKVEEIPLKPKPKAPEKHHWRFKPKLHYHAVAQNIENELDSVLYDFDKYAVEIESDCVDFHNSRINTSEILGLFEESKAKETDKSCRRFFNGTPGRKPGRKRKKNLTGWPNKNKRPPKREHSKEKQEKVDKNSTADSSSLREDSDEDGEQPKQVTDIKTIYESDCKKNGSDTECCDIDRVSTNKKTLNCKVKNAVLQPYVYVQKLDNKIIGSHITTVKRTVKKRKCTPGSPKSPRKLRKPRGRWYKER